MGNVGKMLKMKNVWKNTGLFVPVMSPMQQTASELLPTTLPTMQLRDVSEGGSSVYTQRLLEAQTSYNFHVRSRSPQDFLSFLFWDTCY